MAVPAMTDIVTIRVDRFRRWLPQLVAATAAIGGVEPAALVAPGRTGWNVTLRYAIILAAVDVFGKGWSEIARALGGRNHGAMLHGYRAAQRLATRDAEFQKLALLVRSVAHTIANGAPSRIDTQPEPGPQPVLAMLERVR